jgi:hypothetical protein
MVATRTRHGGGFANENKERLNFCRLRFAQGAPAGVPDEVSIVPG